MPPANQPQFADNRRVRLWYALLALAFGLFVVRLFHLQIIRHDHYVTAARHGQLREYEIPAERGAIEARSGDGFLPIVLNEVRYTLFADPKFVDDPAEAASRLQTIIGGDAGEYERLMRQADRRYVVLARKLDRPTKEAIERLALSGVGTQETQHRTYPQGSLAAQLLGFVNNDGEGMYGIEQALNDELRGKPGRVRAITDVGGVPLAVKRDNVVVQPERGSRVALTIDVGIQARLEAILRAGLERARSDSGGAIIMDPNTGAVRAMANYPTFSPAEFFNVGPDNARVFQNAIVSDALEVGSIMKPLTLAAALNEGAVSRDQVYYDPGSFTVDGHRVTNVEAAGGPGPRTLRDILGQSLNTGATWLLKQMGGGEINQQARQIWHDYMTNRFRFGQSTGIEQGHEAGGIVPNPRVGYGLNLQYANSTFGQGMTATPLQMAAAMSAVINGGRYYQPRLVEKIIRPNGEIVNRQPNLLKDGVVNAATAQTVREFMEHVFTANHRLYGMREPRPQYAIGGKTGTAQIPRPGGGYFDDRFNGLFIGFVGGNTIEYVIVVRVNQPRVPGFAGSRAAAPIFADLANMLIDNFGVLPRQ